MDNIALSFSKLDISVGPRPIRFPDVSFNDQVITRVQERQLIEARLEVTINPDHEIPTMVGDYCTRWAIPVRAAQNFMFLACGNLKFPVLLLQNPSTGHDTLDSEAMVRDCPTLVWVKDVLEGLGLSINDVVILDVCPLLSDVWLKSTTETQVQEAIKEAYELIENILVLLRPEIVIACQCATGNPSIPFGLHASEFTRELGSSWSTAEQKRVVRLQHREHVFNIVQAYHPRSFIGRGDANAPKRETLLKETLTHFLAPCGKWKVEITTLLQLDKMITSWLEVTEKLESTTNKFLKTLDRFTALLQDGTITVTRH